MRILKRELQLQLRIEYAAGGYSHLVGSQGPFGALHLDCDADGRQIRAEGPKYN